ncbi:MAG: formyltransferase family protein [Phycisphaerales bacterium]
MRLVIVTMVDRGFPSVCLPRLVEAFGNDVHSIVMANAPQSSRTGRLRQIARKVRRIGALGAINGLRMRRWYGRDVAEALRLDPIEVVAARLGVPLHASPSINDERTVALLGGANADLGLCLGTTWLSPAVHSVPRHGMINVHHELLPEFRNAQSVIWSIHEGRRTTGFTIHRIAPRMDAGDVLWREETPILFRATLGETVTATYADLLTRSAARLVEVVRDFDALAARAQPQRDGRTFTTPTWSEYRRMRAQFARLRGVTG